MCNKAFYCFKRFIKGQAEVTTTYIGRGTGYTVQYNFFENSMARAILCSTTSSRTQWHGLYIYCAVQLLRDFNNNKNSQICIVIHMIYN
jgi:hypothetical protein